MFFFVNADDDGDDYYVILLLVSFQTHSYSYLKRTHEFRSKDLMIHFQIENWKQKKLDF